MAGNQVPVGLGPATDLWVQLMFRRGVNLDELAEDQDPRAFPSEGARKRAIKIDRWSGRHRVLVTAVTAVLAAVAAYFAWEPHRRRVGRLAGGLRAAVRHSLHGRLLARVHEGTHQVPPALTGQAYMASQIAM